MRNVVWSLPEMAYFGNLAADVMGYERQVAGGFVGNCDTVHVVGMYDPPQYNKTLKATSRAKQRVIHWCGSDVLYLSDASFLPDAVHVCDSDDLKRELYDKGVDATTVMWPTRHHFPVTPLKPRVCCYLGTDPVKYGNDVLVAIGEALPEVDIIGYAFGQYGPDEMKELVDGSSVYVRLTSHDGSGASAREFMEAGRRAIVTHDLEYATRVRKDDLTGVIAAIRKALKETEPDWEAAAYWHEQNSNERFAAELKAVCDGRA